MLPNIVPRIAPQGRPSGNYHYHRCPFDGLVCLEIHEFHWFRFVVFYFAKRTPMITVCKPMQLTIGAAYFMGTASSRLVGFCGFCKAGPVRIHTLAFPLSTCQGPCLLYAGFLLQGASFEVGPPNKMASVFLLKKQPTNQEGMLDALNIAGKHTTNQGNLRAFLCSLLAIFRASAAPSTKRHQCVLWWFGNRHLDSLGLCGDAREVRVASYGLSHCFFGTVELDGSVSVWCLPF